MKVHREIPISEITLRKFEKPHGDKREISRKFLMSVGLLQPGESRDFLLDIFLFFIKHRGKIMRTRDVVQNVDVSQSNLRRHLKRLRDAGFVERISGGYRIRENMKIGEIVDEILLQNINSSLARVREYARELDK